MPSSAPAVPQPLSAHSLSSRWTDWGKWLALISMTIDHVTRYALPDDWSLGWASDTLGRVAFPLFAAMVAWHGLFDTRNPWRYARRILVIGLFAQLPYLLMPRLYNMVVLNVCFTLTLGLILGSVLMRLVQRPPERWSEQLGVMLASLAVVVVALAFGEMLDDRLEYGRLGVLLVPVFMLTLALCARTRGAGRWLIVPAVIMLALVAQPLNFVPVSQWITLATCGLVIALVLGGACHVSGTPPWLAMPRWLWLGWYPGHLTLIALWVLMINP